jgi:CHAT domain-containing protein
LQSKLLCLQEAQDNFMKMLESKNPAYYAMKYNIKVLALPQFKAYLITAFDGLPATFIEYFMGDSATYAIKISSKNTEIKKLNYSEINANNFLKLINQNIKTKQELNALLSSAYTLNKQLIEPLNIQDGHLIISQDGIFLPFESFSKSPSSKSFLLENYAISYSYSAQFLTKNKTNSGFGINKKFIGFAPINFDNNKLNALKGSELALETIGDNYLFAKKLIGKEATKNNFLTQANNFQIVQLFTHAIADSNDTEPRIYFSDSSLKISEISTQNKFKTNLLVLTACKTGTGKVAKGEGVLSLTRGFSMLGIPSTITSLWSVEDADTYALTNLFYKYMNQGQNKDNALQSAKLEFIKTNPNTTPYAWAGLILVGDSNKILSNQYLVWVLIGLFILVFGILAVVYKTRLYRHKKTLI